MRWLFIGYYCRRDALSGFSDITLADVNTLISATPPPARRQPPPMDAFAALIAAFFASCHAATLPPPGRQIFTLSLVAISALLMPDAIFSSVRPLLRLRQSFHCFLPIALFFDVRQPPPMSHGLRRRPIRHFLRLRFQTCHFFIIAAMLIAFDISLPPAPGLLLSSSFDSLQLSFAEPDFAID